MAKKVGRKRAETIVERVDKHIKLSKEISERLDRYIDKEFGHHKPFSAIVEKAIVEYLNKEDNKQ